VFEKGRLMESASPKPKAQSSTSSGVVVPHKPTWQQRAAGTVVCLLIRFVAATLRYRWIDRSGFLTSPPAGPAIYCIWHNRLALCMSAYHRYIKSRSGGKGLVALISASKDGGFLAAILERFGVTPVRGSTSRRGPQALRELTTWARRSYDIAITPDGPRGPRYVVQDGAMSLAQLTGFQIVPVSYRLQWKISLNSWDAFQIPLPFSRCEMIIEKPMCVPREISETERETLREKLEMLMQEMSDDTKSAT
jgi:lysophospholipid acyltransferase (LPLAT)-like uncharacterized protein